MPIEPTNVNKTQNKPVTVGRVKIDQYYQLVDFLKTDGRLWTKEELSDHFTEILSVTADTIRKHCMRFSSVTEKIENKHVPLTTEITIEGEKYTSQYMMIDLLDKDGEPIEYPVPPLIVRVPVDGTNYYCFSNYDPYTDHAKYTDKLYRLVMQAVFGEEVPLSDHTFNGTEHDEDYEEDDVVENEPSELEPTEEEIAEDEQIEGEKVSDNVEEETLPKKAAKKSSKRGRKLRK